ncbi:MAG: TorF family putative porin [Pseudomonadota bacterium]
MRTSFGSLVALILAVTATPAFADETDPPPNITISGSATLVSDYRFRGISQTDKRFAVQGTFTVASKTGLYATVWGSSIDDYVFNGADQEIDLSVGYKKAFGATTVDVGVLYYYYPGSGGITSDFFEPYGSVTYSIGPVSAKASVAYAPKQAALRVVTGVTEKRDNLYVAGDLSGGIPNTPVSLSAHIGHNFGPSYLSIGKEYTDYSIGASVTRKNITLGVQYVDTDANFITPSGRNASKGGLVFSLGASF